MKTGGGSLFLGVLVLLFLGEFPGQVVSVQRYALKDAALYTFQNVWDRGFLTNPMGTELIVTAPWPDIRLGLGEIPGQKWQVSKGYVYTSYLMKPLSEGMDSKYSMEGTKTNGVIQVKKSHYTFGLSSALYWSIIPAEGQFYMIQNLDDDLCLETQGIGKPVTMSTCRMSQSQQWAIHARP